jgi:hypothetical protein
MGAMEKIQWWLGRLSVRHIGFAVIVIVALMCLFPPWRVQLPENGFNISIGYAFLFPPPSPLAAVDAGKLIVQVLLIAAFGGGLGLLRWPSRKV